MKTLFFSLFLLICYVSSGVCQENTAVLETTNGLFSNIVVDENDLYFNDDCTGNIYKLSKDGGSREILATNQIVRKLVIYSNYLYWCGNGAIKMMPTTGGSISTITSNSSWNLYEGIQGLQVDASGIYWTVSGGADISESSGLLLGIVSKWIVDPIELSKTPPTIFAKQLRIPNALIVDADYFYWKQDDPSSTGRGEIRKLGKHGGEPITISRSFDSISAFIANKHQIYFASAGAIYKLSQKGGAAQKLCDAGRWVYLTINNGILYYTDFDSDKLLQIAINGGQPIVVSTGISNPRALVSDNKFVFWSEGVFQGTINVVEQDLNKPFAHRAKGYDSGY